MRGLPSGGKFTVRYSGRGIKYGPSFRAGSALWSPERAGVGEPLFGNPPLQSEKWYEGPCDRFLLIAERDGTPPLKLVRRRLTSVIGSGSYVIPARVPRFPLRTAEFTADLHVDIVDLWLSREANVAICSQIRLPSAP